jgi:ABC-type transport system involved in multi-copper enzyme maturation permease subunit
MLWYKAWRESCMRFFISAAIVAVMCLVYTFFHAHFYPSIVYDHPYVHTYIQYIHMTIFGGATRLSLQLCCLVLGLGGLQRDRNQNTLDFTLALPVSRVTLVSSRAALGWVQVLMLSALPSLFVPAASYLAGEHLPLGYALRFIPLWAAGGIFTFSISFLASVLFGREYVSLAVAFLAFSLHLTALRVTWLNRFHLHASDFMSGLFPHYLDPITMHWSNTYALLPIAGFLAAAVALLLLGGAVTCKQDA